MNWKKFLPLLPLLLLTGCASTFTRVTPLEQPRNPDNLYPVEVIFSSDQQSLRWDSIKASVLVNGQAVEMRRVPLVKNRWEGVISVPPGVSVITYRFKFDYLHNVFGSQPQPDSIISKIYAMKIVEQP